MITKKCNLDDYTIYNTLIGSGCKVELRSGKWFINGEERPYDDDDASVREVLVNSFPGIFGSGLVLDRWIKWFIAQKGRSKGEWPEMPIITRAKERLAKGERPFLRYSLTRKELEIINYLLVGDEKDTYAIFFYGVGGSGKSTVCNLIASIFGNGDVCRCGFNDLGRVFARERLAGKRLWYDADISPNWNENNSNILKKVVTHDKDQFEQKGKTPYEAQYRAKPLFCCNVPPRFDMTDSGLLRRILYYSKNEKIQNPDGSLANREWTQDELENFVMAALQTPFNAKDFEQETHDIIMKTNSVAKWGMDVDYDIYCERCQENKVPPFGKEKVETLKELFASWK